MSISKLFNLGLTMAAIIVCTPSAQGQTTSRYPSGPVKFIVPYTPGGLVDTIARQVGNALSPGLGQPIVVENRPGAGTNIATEATVRAAGWLRASSRMPPRTAKHSSSPLLRR